MLNKELLEKTEKTLKVLNDLIENSCPIDSQSYEFCIEACEFDWCDMECIKNNK